MFDISIETKVGKMPTNIFDILLVLQSFFSHTFSHRKRFFLVHRFAPFYPISFTNFVCFPKCDKMFFFLSQFSFLVPFSE